MELVAVIGIYSDGLFIMILLFQMTNGKPIKNFGTTFYLRPDISLRLVKLENFVT